MILSGFIFQVLFVIVEFLRQEHRVAIESCALR